MKTPLALLLLIAATSLSRHARAQENTTPAPPANKATDATLDGYRQHLRALSAQVDACAKARTMDACDPAQVGPDDEVPLSDAPNAEHRLVRYGWLRVLIAQARDKDAPPPKPHATVDHPASNWENIRPIPPTTTQLLESAKARLATDLAQTSAPLPAMPDHSQERTVMKQVLSGREYRDLEGPTAKDTTMEKVGNWLNHLIDSAVRASARAPWLGRVLVWGFVGLVCVALVWALLQLERRWRVRLIPENHEPAPGAASAIPWQSWLDDARRAAAAGLWREAIHFLYWAAISRLESKKLWPADRARTPREYLALVATDDPRQPGLASLTGSFEHVWYGGRPAAESDYRSAEQIATTLIHGGGKGSSTLQAEGSSGG